MLGGSDPSKDSRKDIGSENSCQRGNAVSQEASFSGWALLHHPRNAMVSQLTKNVYFVI